MSKRIIIALIIFLAILPSPFPTAFADESEVRPQAAFVLPLSLREIEEESFSGTAVQTVVFPEGFLRIGENAFRGALRLTNVYIPYTTRYIADSAFSQTPDLTIHGVRGSYAQKWARKHSVPFVVDNIWKAVIRDGKNLDTEGAPTDRYIEGVNPERIISSHERGEDEGKRKRPQDRPELNPIDYRFP